MSPENPGGSRQGDSGTQAIPESGGLPAPGAMSDLLGGAGRRIAEVLQEADVASKSIIEQARSDARRHNEDAMREAEYLSRQSIERLDRITAQMSAQADALQRHARELADVMRHSNDALSEELGIARAPEVEPVDSEAKKALEPTTQQAGAEAEASDPPTRAPVALRELFGFKRRRFTDNPPPDDGSGADDERVLVASSGEDAGR